MFSEVLNRLTQGLRTLLRRSGPAPDPEKASKQSEILQQLDNNMPEDIKDYKLKSWDKGLFTYELQPRFIDPHPDRVAEQEARQEEKEKKDLLDQIEKGTYAGTQLALTELYDRIDHKYASILRL